MWAVESMDLEVSRAVVSRHLELEVIKYADSLTLLV